MAIHEATWGLDLTPEMSQVDQRPFVSGFAEYQGFKTLTVLQISVEIFYKTTVNHCGLNGGQFISQGLNNSQQTGNQLYTQRQQKDKALVSICKILDGPIGAISK